MCEQVMVGRSLAKLEELKTIPPELPLYSLHVHSCKRAAKLVTKGAGNRMRLGKEGWL